MRPTSRDAHPEGRLVGGSMVILYLAGAVALLLWGTRMVRTGVERAYGSFLRVRLRTALDNRVLATTMGALLAIAFQSGTAVILIVSGFVASGIVGGAAGLTAVLGADLGSAIVVKVLSYDLGPLIPLCLFTGTAIFLSTERREWRQFGRILVGVGLLLLSLRLIGEAAEPLRQSSLFPVIVGYLRNDWPTAFLLSAVAAWLFHSSVATILLVAALSLRQVIPADLGVVMVLGANVGGTIVAVILSRTAPPAARILPYCNLVIRTCFAILAVIAFGVFAPPLSLIGANAAQQLVHAHILFNMFVVVLAAPFAGPIFRLVERLVLATSSAEVPATSAREASALDERVLDRPTLALANATREVVGICESVEIMIRDVMELYRNPVAEREAALAAIDERIDSRHSQVKLYLSRIDLRTMNEREARRAHELLDACVKLEQAGDVVTRSMLFQVRRMRSRSLTLDPTGRDELTTLHGQLLANARLAFNVLVSRDAEIALQLVREKDRFREFEERARLIHFDQLRQGQCDNLDVGAMHLDTIQNFKQINALLAALAYPILSERGLLNPSRLSADAA